MNTIQAARLYVQRGWRVVPIPHGEKAPRLKNWQNLRLTEEELDLYLSPDSNVGLILGAVSGGLTDVDLDSPTARAVAAELLPPTPMVHGRRSSPRSHYWYICPTLGESRIQYADPEHGLLLEIRADGHQTCVPPATHPSGEVLEWQGALEPATVDGESLKRACGRAAAAAALAARWRDGIRNELSLCLAGYLARCGWAEQEALDFLQVICAAARDSEWRNRLDACRRTFQRVAAGEPATGMPSVAELLGERVAQQLGEWLGGGRVNFNNEQQLHGALNTVELLLPPAPESDAEDDLPEVVDLASIQPTPTRWLVEGLIPEGFTTNLYGIGGAGKSLLALRLALSLLQGRPFLGYAVHRRARCILYLDFEFDAERHAERWHAVCAGAGLSQPPAGLLYLRVRTDFFTFTKDLFKLAARYKPDLIILDSVGRAIIDPLDVKRIQALYNTVDALGTTTLLIDHPAKPTAELSEEHGTEYGSAYKRYNARSVLQVVKGEARGNELGIRIKHAKANLDTTAPETDVRIVFHKADGLLERVEFYWGSDAMQKPELFGRKGEVLQYLHEQGIATASEVSKGLGIPETTAREVLNRLEQAGLVVSEGYRPKKYRPVEGGATNNNSTPINSPWNCCSPAGAAGSNEQQFHALLSAVELSNADALAEGGSSNNNNTVINSPRKCCSDADLEHLLQQLQADDLAPISDDEAAALRRLWQAAAAHDFPRLQLPSLLILAGRTAWLDACKLLAGTAEVSLALSLLQRANGHGFTATPSDGDAVHTPTGDLQSGTTAYAQAN